MQVRKNKAIRTIILLALAAFLLYQSIYIRKLSDVKSNVAAKLDTGAFAQKLWDEKFPAKLDGAISLDNLVEAVSADPDFAFEEFTNALAIGNYRYALVKLDGVVKEVREDECLIATTVADSMLMVKVATEFIFGNALRDASALIAVKDYPNSDDLNGISESLNKIVRTNVIPPFKQSVKNGDKVAIVGAIEINKEHIHWQGSEIIPVRLQITN